MLLPQLQATATVLVALAGISLSGCTDPAQNIESQLDRVERALGPGWTCHSVPDQFKLAGIVLERTEDGVYFFHDNFQDAVNIDEASVAIFNQSFITDMSIPHFDRLLSLFGLSSPVGIGGRHRTTVELEYGQPRRQVLGHAGVQAVSSILGDRLTDRSTYLLIRESISADEIRLVLERDRTSLLASPEDENAQTIVSLTEQGGVELSKTFDSKLGICSLTQTLRHLPENGALADLPLEERFEVLPRNVSIEPM